MSGANTNLDNVNLGKMKSRWEAGDRAEEIAEDFKVHPNTVRYQAKQRGWERGSKRNDIISKMAEVEKQTVIADKINRSVEESERFIGDADRLRTMVLNFQARLLKNRDPNTNELLMDKDDAELVFQYLKCCKIAMETLSVGYIAKRKAYGMDESHGSEITVLPWED